MCPILQPGVFPELPHINVHCVVLWDGKGRTVREGISEMILMQDTVRVIEISVVVSSNNTF